MHYSFSKQSLRHWVYTIIKKIGPYFRLASRFIKWCFIHGRYMHYMHMVFKTYTLHASKIEFFHDFWSNCLPRVWARLQDAHVLHPTRTMWSGTYHHRNQIERDLFALASLWPQRISFKQNTWKDEGGELFFFAELESFTYFFLGRRGKNWCCFCDWNFGSVLDQYRVWPWAMGFFLGSCQPPTLIEAMVVGWYSLGDVKKPMGFLGQDVFRVEGANLQASSW